MANKGTVLIVDDDEDFRDSLCGLLEAGGYEVVAFKSGQEFLQNIDRTQGICVVTDVRMPGMDGLELQAELSARKSGVPVIVMTGHGDVPLAVRAMRAGAVDFLEKPFEPQVLFDSIERARAQGENTGDKSETQKAALEKIALLTGREQEVMDLLAEGHQNKVIAHRLNISPRTVEVHRSRVMEKLAVRSLPELVHLCLAANRKPAG